MLNKLHIKGNKLYDICGAYEAEITGYLVNVLGVCASRKRPEGKESKVLVNANLIPLIEKYTRIEK